MTVGNGAAGRITASGWSNLVALARRGTGRTAHEAGRIVRPTTWVSEDNHRRQQARNHCHRIVYPGPDRTQRTRHKLSAHEMVSYEIRRYKYRENIRTETFVRSHPHTPWGEEPQRLPFRVGQSRAQTRRPTHLSPPAERMRGVRSATGRIFEYPPNPPC